MFDLLGEMHHIVEFGNYTGICITRNEGMMVVTN